MILTDPNTVYTAGLSLLRKVSLILAMGLQPLKNSVIYAMGELT